MGATVLSVRCSNHAEDKNLLAEYLLTEYRTKFLVQCDMKFNIVCINYYIGSHGTELTPQT